MTTFSDLPGSRPTGYFLEMLEAFKSISDGHQGCIKQSSHRNDLLNDEVRPSHLAPYLVVPYARQFAATEVNRVLIEICFEPDTIGWAAPVVFASKMDGPLRVYVDYCRLNTVATRDLYPSLPWTNASTASDRQ